MAAEDPFNNPNAPVRPLAMAEYASPEREAAKRADEEQARMMAAAQKANHISDDYVILTVRFAAVLFFGGIVSTFEVAATPHRRVSLAGGAFCRAGDRLRDGSQA